MTSSASIPPAHTVGDARWLDPSPLSGPDTAPLSNHHVQAWRTAGAVVVDGLVPRHLVDAARAAVVAATPQPDDDAPADFGSGGAFVFPSESDAFNSITLHPRLLAAVAQLLGCSVRDIRLTQSDLWPKRGRVAPVGDANDNTDQRMHVDYPNHTLAHPPEWERPEAVEMIIYADDVSECDGATAVVLRDGPDDPAYRWPIVDTPGVGAYRWVNDRSSAERSLAEVAPAVAEWRHEHLYARERSVRYRPGTTLLYRHDTWHRGTPIRPGRVRVAHNLTFRRAPSEWVSTLHIGWAWASYRATQTIERIIAESSVDQRCVLGFPAPTSPYWTEATIAAVEARYHALGIDMAEYRAALPRP